VFHSIGVKVVACERSALNAKGAKEKRKGSQSKAVCLNCNELAGVTTPSLFPLLSVVYGVWGVDRIFQFDWFVRNAREKGRAGVFE